MDFHGRQRAEFAGEFLGLERERFLGGFAADQFRREAGDGDGGFAAEGLERRAVNDAPAVLLLELHPQPQHLAAIGVADRAHGIGVGQLAHVLRIGEGRLNAFLEIVGHVNEEFFLRLKGRVLLHPEDEPDRKEQREAYHGGSL